MQELRIQRVAQEVHQGLQFMYRSTSDNMGGWHSDLGRLSGGERTLVSLALILAVHPLLCASLCQAARHAQTLIGMVTRSMVALLSDCCHSQDFVIPRPATTACISAMMTQNITSFCHAYLLLLFDSVTIH